MYGGHMCECGAGAVMRGINIKQFTCWLGEAPLGGETIKNNYSCATIWV